MEDTATTLLVWGFDPEVEEPEIFDLLYNNGGRSLVSVSIERDELQKSLGRARAVFWVISVTSAGIVCCKKRTREVRQHCGFSCNEGNPIESGILIYGNNLRNLTNKKTHHVLDQDAMVLSNFPVNSGPIFMPLYYFPEWRYPAVVTEMTQGSTSQMNSLGQGRAMIRNPQDAQGVMFPPHFPPSFVLQQTIAAEMTQGSTSQVVGQSRMGDVHVANQRYEEFREGMERKLILYVGNFSYDLEETGLRNLFLQFGEVSSCRIRRDKVSGRSMGDGFVHFLSTEDARRATSLNGQFVNGRRIWVSFAKAKSRV